MSKIPNYEVRFLASAEQDLRQLAAFVAQDSKQKAKKLLSQLVETCQRLAQFPLRGQIPPELMGFSEQYLQIHQGPYRLIYRIEGAQVFIFAVLDGRRDLSDLLINRFT